MSEPTESNAGAGSAGFEVYADFIEQVLAAQEARKASIEQRGVAVITTSGALVTLLFAVIGLATKRSQTYSLPDETQAWLVAAVVLLVLAAACGLAANAPLNYKNVRAANLRMVVDKMWSETAWAAAARVSSNPSRHDRACCPGQRVEGLGPVRRRCHGGWGLGSSSGRRHPDRSVSCAWFS